MTCQLEIDDRYTCPKSSVTFCESCGQDRCPDHLRVCGDCGGVYCYLSNEPKCLTGHLCAGSRASEVTKTYAA